MIESAVWDENELATIQNKDRLLPSQPYFSKMYNGSDFYGDLERVLCEINGWAVWDLKFKEGMTYAVMGSDINTLHFFQFLIRSHGYKGILELGTYVGLSAMYMAQALPPDGWVVTIERGQEFYDIACENIKRNNFNNIEVICENALSFVGDTRGVYDLIFIDAAKEIYLELLKCSLNLLTKKGMILVDDVFFQGDTLNEIPISEKGKGVRAMLDYVATLEGYEKVILPIGNGLLMLRKM